MKTKKKAKRDWIRWFQDIRIEDIPSVGGKTASLGEMYRELSPKGVQIPNGFAITADAYRYFLQTDNLGKKINAALEGLDTHNLKQLRSKGNAVRQLILGTELPQKLVDAIANAYKTLCAGAKETIDVAVRSSATAEDLPDVSFAGQQESYLNVQGIISLIDSCRMCFASLFTDRAISYRGDQGFEHFDIALSICVQRMVRSDLASSGVLFTIDTETGFRDLILINASYGLGENIVKGSVNPDEFYVFKPTLKKGFRSIVRKTLGRKEFKLIYASGGSKMVQDISVSHADQVQFSISDDDVMTLAHWGCMIEDHYTKKRRSYTPMDIEWAKDGRTGELFIVQARPETVQSQKKDGDTIASYSMKEEGKVLVHGRSVGEKIAQGVVRVIRNVQDLNKLKKGEILVTEKTDPDWEPAMKLAAAIVTNRGGRTCHAAIISRELGVAAIVGTEIGTEILKTGQQVTVSCAQGDTGFVYEGKLKFEVQNVVLGKVPKTRTALMMNLANPSEALRLRSLPNEGVGLVRMEFMIGNTIQIHPLALLNFDTLKDLKAKKHIEQLTMGWKDKPSYFVDKLAQGVGLIAAAFYPKDVIVRMSDFKSNEYANLIGGKDFEPTEENPMLGFRGASRYYHPKYRDGFALECKAMKRVRDEFGLTNVKLMIPFCRTVDEGKRVVREMETHGLKRSKNGLEIYVMCEIPSNVILADQFAKVFDGFSIGSNDLTQLVLGIDRDSELIAPLFDERNDAVKAMTAHVIQKLKKLKKKIGICGQAPSDYPDFAKFLVEQGIDSISLNPDVILKTTMMLADLEAKHKSTTQRKKKTAKKK